MLIGWQRTLTYETIPYDIVGMRYISVPVIYYPLDP
jgi:hypothetical protein